MSRTPQGMRAGRRIMQLKVEALEARVSLSSTAVAGVAKVADVTLVGGTLVVEGTNGSDRIAITTARTAGDVRVVVNGVTREYEGVGSLVVRAGAGDDVVRVSERVTLPARIEGGAGDDRLQAGSGAQNLLGGDGDDVIIGGGGRSALDGGSGRDRIVIARPLGTILIGPSAVGEALRILGRGYKLAHLRSRNAASTGPIVVGVADLDRAEVVRRLRASYEAGQTVALADAAPPATPNGSASSWATTAPRNGQLGCRERR